MTEQKNNTTTIDNELKSVVFTMEYKRGPYTGTKNFLHSGDLRSAIEKCQAHCKLMGYKFTHVKPFLSDLVEDEKRALEG